MLIGVSTLPFVNEAFERALELFEKDLDFIEIMDDGQHDLGNSLEWLKSYDKTYFLHAPITDVNISSFDERYRRLSIERIKEHLELMAPLDLRLMVVHPGFYVWRSNEEEAREALKKSARELEQLQEEYSLKITLENMGNWAIALLKYPWEFEDLPLSMTLDVGHAHIMNVLEEFLTDDIDIAHAHIHDNMGVHDEHLEIGMGTIDWEKILPLLKDSGAALSLEVEEEEYIEGGIRRLLELK